MRYAIESFDATLYSTSGLVPFNKKRLGQTSRHFWHNVHFSVSIVGKLNLSPKIKVIAEVGQTTVQVPHPQQILLFIIALIERVLLCSDLFSLLVLFTYM
jgi:hypothetical protein